MKLTFKELAINNHILFRPDEINGLLSLCLGLDFHFGPQFLENSIAPSACEGVGLNRHCHPKEHSDKGDSSPKHRN
jgi:hypothetical protein